MHKELASNVADKNRRARGFPVLVGIGILMSLFAVRSCNRQRSTDDLIDDLRSYEEVDRLKAVRLLPNHKGDAAKVVPALIASLKDSQPDVRWSAAISLGSFGAKAESALPALEEAQKDKDARVREGARVAISRIKG